MTNLTNINRDAFWTSEQPFLSYNQNTSILTPSARTNGAFYTNHGAFRSSSSATPQVDAGNVSMLGCMFTPPANEYEDNLPFRVRGYHGVNPPDGGGPSNTVPYLFWGFGYVSSLNGDVAMISGPNYFAMTQGVIDEWIMIRKPTNGQDEGRSLIFYTGVGELDGNTNVHSSLSVQNTGIGVDQFSTAIW